MSITEEVNRQLEASARGQKALDAQAGSHIHSEPQWPTMDRCAYYGLAGEVVATIAPHTEADPVALLVQFLAAAGSCIGRYPYYTVEDDRHYPNLYAVMVGQSSKSRKGTSWGRIRSLFAALEGEPWLRDCTASGLSSGEGLIWRVRDPIIGREKTGKGNDIHYIDVEQDPGVSDKRLMVIESEYANILRVLTREGNTLSRVLRDGWDQGNLATMTKNSPARATGAHLSIVGHVTAEELRRYLDRTEAANGFANRFMFVCVKRSRTLPHGSNLSEAELAPLAQRLAIAIADARRISGVTMDAEAMHLWERVYPGLSEGQPGLLGAITGRSEAQVIRVALVYALLDSSEHIRQEHLLAALALWDYAEESARYIWGATLGDPVADEIMRAITKSGTDGMSRTEISGLFKRNRSAAQIGRALDLLVQHNRAYSKTTPTEGRPTEIWYAGGSDGQVS